MNGCGPLTLSKVLSATWAELKTELGILASPSTSGVREMDSFLIADPLLFYARVRYHYLRAEISELGAILASVPCLEPREFASFLLSLGRLRLQIRVQEVHIGELECLEEEWPKLSLPDPRWQAEAFMVLAMAYETLDQHGSAYARYLRSAEIFRACGEIQKSLFAELNSIAAESHIHPGAHQLLEYQDLKTRALNYNCFSPAGTAALNLSREYQAMGASKLALKSAEEAVQILTRHDFGTYQYYMALAQRCHTLLDLGQTQAAQFDFEEIACATLPEAAALHKTLCAAVPEFATSDIKNSARESGKLPQTWRERERNRELEKIKQGLKHSQKQDQHFTDLEEQLIVTLLSSPLALSELAVQIYGEALPLMSTQDRTKQILRRVRQKAPGLIVLEHGRYRIA